MKIGVAKEIKEFENRVALTPNNAKILVDDGHEVVFETGAGEGSNFPDSEYEEAGVTIVDDPVKVWESEMVMKVKEPLKSEYKYFHDGLILFTYLHLAPELELTKELMDSNVTAVAYETMEEDGSLPLLTPMSEVAGRSAVQLGAQFLEKTYGGKGILLGSVPGVDRGNVTIIGGGVVGLNSAKIANGLGANVTILDVDPGRLAELEDIFNGNVQTLMSNSENIAASVKEADLVIAGVLIAGAKAPVLVTEEMVKTMTPGSVIVDIAIDQGGNVETSTHSTTHNDPVYEKHGVLHYAVANVPGAVPRTSTKALTNVTVKYARQIAEKGFQQSALDNHTILTGANTYKGKLTNKAVAESQNREYTDVNTLLN